MTLGANTAVCQGQDTVEEAEIISEELRTSTYISEMLQDTASPQQNYVKPVFSAFPPLPLQTIASPMLLLQYFL